MRGTGTRRSGPGSPTVTTTTLATPAYVQGASTTSSSSAAFSSAVTAGDLLVLGVTTNNSSGTDSVTGVSDSLNGAWTEAVSQPYGNGHVDLWYLQGSKAGSDTVTVSGSSGAITIAEYAGIAATGALGEVAAGTTGGITLQAGPTAAIGEAGELVVGVGGQTYVGSGFTAGSAFTLREQAVSNYLDAAGLEDTLSASALGQYMTMGVPSGAATGQGYAGAVVAVFQPASTSSSSSADACSGAGDNSGLLCMTTAPSLDGSHPTVTTYGYDPWGQRTSMTTPDENADAQAGSAYTYAYFLDTATDLSGMTHAGGWLAGVTDPSGQFVAYGYDAEGDVVRTWDRDATAQKGLPLSDYPGTCSTPPALGFTQSLYAAACTAPPGLFLLSQTDALGNVTSYQHDADGNQLGVRAPRGNLNGVGYPSCPTVGTYDTCATYNANGQQLTVQQPVEAQQSKVGLLERVRELPKLHPVAQRAANVDVVSSRPRWRGTTSSSTCGTSGSGSSRGCGWDPTDRVVRHEGKEAALTTREFELLQFLLDHPHRFYTTSQITGFAWSDAALSPEEVRNYVGRVEKDPGAAGDPL